MALVNARIPIETVTPQVWKKIMKMPGKATKAAGPTREEVDAAAKAYAKEHGKPAAKALITKHGGTDLASIPEKAWAAFVADTKNAPADEPAEDDDGL